MLVLRMAQNIKTLTTISVSPHIHITQVYYEAHFKFVILKIGLILKDQLLLTVLNTESGPFEQNPTNETGSGPPECKKCFITCVYV